MESAIDRLNEKPAELPEDEREALAKDMLKRMAMRRWYDREIRPAVGSHARGESIP